MFQTLRINVVDINDLCNISSIALKMEISPFQPQAHTRQYSVLFFLTYSPGPTKLTSRTSYGRATPVVPPCAMYAGETHWKIHKDV